MVAVNLLPGSVDDTDGHDKQVLGPIGEILEEKEDKDLPGLHWSTITIGMTRL